MIKYQILIILVTVHLCISTLDGYSQTNKNVQYGSRVLYLHTQQIDNEVNSLSSHQFQVLYRNSYELAPATILGLIGSLQNRIVSQVQSAKLIKGRITTKLAEIKIKATRGIKMIKIAYFFLRNQDPSNMDIVSIYSTSLLNINSISREEEYIEIKQIYQRNIEGERSKKGEYIQSVPMFSKIDLIRSTIILNELKVIQNRHLNISLQIQQNKNYFEIICNCPFQTTFNEQFVSYVIILYNHVLIQNKISFTKSSIPLSSSFRDDYISSDQHIMIGISSMQMSGQSQPFYFEPIHKTYQNQSSGALLVGTSTILFLQISKPVEDQKVVDGMPSIQDEKLKNRILVACSPPLYSTLYTNAWHLWKDPVKTSTETCQPCPTGCWSCHFCSNCMRFVNCTSCRAGFTYKKLGLSGYPSNQYVCRCTNNGFQNATTFTCLGCADVIPFCTSCINLNSGHFSPTCGKCTTGYFTVPSDGSWGGYIECGKCIAGCSGCSSFTSCTTCGTGLVNVNGICSCSSSTSYYSATTKTCTTCPLAITGCVTCTAVGAATTCVSCNTGFFLTNGTCTACQTNCLSCSITTCSSCALTFIVSGNTCVCDQAAQFFFNNSTKKCQYCSKFITGCEDCNLVGGTMSCFNCTTGSYYNGTACITCPTYCFDCDDTSACTSCIKNLQISGSGCSCPSGSSLNLLTSTCIICSELFPSCSSCSTNSSTSLLECNDCETGYYVGSLFTCETCPPQCQDCSTSSICISCISGYSFNNVTNDCDCIDCANCTAEGLINCSSCIFNVTNSSYQCSGCIGGFYLSGINCQVCPPGCATCTSNLSCLTCSLPFIPNGGGLCVCNSLILEYYDPIANTCDSCGNIITNCTSCSSVIYSTSCLKCLDGYYTDGISCLQCSNLCPLCQSSTVCLSCINSYSLINGSCLCNNASQLFRSNITGFCQLCSVIISTQCLFCQLQPAATATSGVKCTSCVEGYYPDPATYICQQCPQTCTTCTSTVCNDCKPTFTLINDTCRCDDAVNFYPYKSICLPCFAIIEYCFQCTAVGGQTQCISCGPGTFITSFGTQCKLCSLNCANCSSESTCITCNQGYTLSLNASCECITTCSNYLSADSSCISCNMTNSTLVCLACKTGTFLVEATMCSPCPDACSSCVDALNCTICQPSFTLISGQCTCNQYLGEIIYNNLCQACSQMIDGCSSCSLVSSSPSCSACITGWTLDSGICIYCGPGCEECNFISGVINCVTCNDAYSLVGISCNQINFNCSATQYYVAANSSCYSCGLNCASCFDASGCVVCQSTFKNIEGVCICSEGLGFFHDGFLNTCVQCVNTLNGTATYLQNCKRCHQKNGNFDSGIECLECIDRFFVSQEGICVQCSPGCLKCTSPTTCYSCSVPAWTMISGVCGCNNDLSYFTDGLGNCPPCTISNCSLCVSLTECILCDFGYFINDNQTCQLAVCANNETEGVQTCDDGNQIDGDGCSSTCLVQPFYFCNNDVSPSICSYDNRFNIEISEIINDCNKITFKFRIYPYYSYFDSVVYDNFLYQTDLPFSNLLSIASEEDIISYTYQYTNSLQGITVSFSFNPTTLGLTQTSTYPIASTSFVIEATNNQQVLHYSQDKCNQKQSLQTLTEVMEYTSYGLMIASLVPAKIVGLQLSGVMQLSFFTIGSMDNVNILLSPLKKFKSLNGVLLPIDQQNNNRLLQKTTTTPQRISSIEYTSNFIRNCNIMLLVVIVLLLISIFLIIATCIFKNCAPALHSVSQRILKQFMLALILFNCFNFAYSAGIHFRYASHEDSLFVVGTISAICALIFPIIMAIALLVCEQDGFGEFKNKMKTGCVEKGYFVVTIAYRTCLGLYMSTANEQQLSTLIILAISIMFVLYNLVNLPFTKAYHNYRANICHLTQFICLFVAMYYRSMKSSHNPVQTAEITSPVFLQYACILLSLVVSLIVLVYEIYLWIKEFKNERKKDNSLRIQNTNEDLQNDPNESIIMKQKQRQFIRQMELDIAEE